MNKLHVLWGILAALWVFLGSFLSWRNCNCGGAAIPAVVAPAITDAGGISKSIQIADQEKNFSAGTNDNLLFSPNQCDFDSPISDNLTGVFREAATYLTNNPQRLLVLTGLRLGTETNQCQGATDLGYGRADKVKALLLSLGAPEAQIRVQSGSQDIAMFGEKVLGGVRYEFLSGEVGDVEERLRVGNITLYFDTNERGISLTSEQQQYFDDLKFFISQKPDAKISVTGHTDNAGNLKYNQRLSRKRAEFVADYIMSNGIPAKHLVVKGLGPNEPIETNDTAEGKAKNRRVEVKIQ